MTATQPFYVTTSWDDGDQLDMRLADLLDRYGLKGTFYICQNTQNRLIESDIAALAQRHEIGAHTLTHPRLTRVSLEQAKIEIVDSRRWLEDVCGQVVTSFCYPRGLYNAEVRQLVIDAGYSVARTVASYQLQMGDDSFAMPTTIHLYPFPTRPSAYLRARIEPLWRSLPSVWRLSLPLSALRSWPTLALALLHKTAQVGGVWHLWGHSWEIEEYQLWGDLERILAAIRQFPQARPVTNAQMMINNLR